MQEQAASRSVYAGRVFLIALWCGLAAGLMEAALFLALQASGKLVWVLKIVPVNTSILWVSPLTDAAVFLLIALVLMPFVSFWRQKKWDVISSGIFLALGGYALLGVVGRLQEWGQIMLALGSGVLLARLVGRWPDIWLRVVRRTLLPIGALVLLALLLDVASSGWTGKSQGNRPPPASPASPNVLLIVLDTLRADRVGTYGYSRPTSPFLDSYARKSVQFDSAIANSSWTLTSHASLFTGLLPAQHGAMRTPLSPRFTTLAEVLAQRGYATAGISANRGICTEPFGLAQGFTHWESMFTDPVESVMRTSFGRKFKNYARFLSFGGFVTSMPATDVNRRALRWLDQRPQRPFFLFLNYMEMHDPYRPPAEFAARFSATPEKILNDPGISWRRPDPWKNDAEREKILSDSYDALLAYLDSQLRLLFQELDKRRLTDNLLVIITSDHGEGIGDHGIYAHFNVPYIEQVHVPLLIRLPGKTPDGTRISETVGLHQIPATILKLLGQPQGEIPGEPLDVWWTGKPPQSAPVYSEVHMVEGWARSLTADFHYIWQQNGKVEFFNRERDPTELHNLANDPDSQDKMRVFKALADQLPGRLQARSRSNDGQR